MDKIRLGFDLLGERARYERFGGVVQDPRRTLAWVDDLCATGDIALGACERATGGPVALARYVKMSMTAAELAVTVVDDWQGRGVGGALLRELCRQAQQAGLATLTAAILVENRRAVRLMRSVGGVRSGAARAGLVQYMVRLGPEHRRLTAAAAVPPDLGRS